MATFSYSLPTVGGSQDTWGTTLNANWTALGTYLGSVDSAEFQHLSGVTSAIQTQIDGKQASDALLTSLAAQTTAANKVQGYSAADTALLYDFLDEDDFASDSATGIPSQQSVKAYMASGANLPLNGYANVVLKNGFIVKVGKFNSNSDDNQQVNFAAAFPNECLAVFNGGTATAETGWIPWTANTITTTGFKANRANDVDDTKTDQIYVALGW